MDVFAIESAITYGIWAVLVAVKAFAFASSLRFSAEAYTAGGKLTKPAWCAILGIGLAAQLLLYSSPLNILHLAFTIAAFVYLFDVRPTLSELTRR